MTTSNPPSTTNHFVDDKTPLCIPFILSRLADFDREQQQQQQQQQQAHNDTSTPPPRPFILGLNGVQGVGKTTLVRSLAFALQDQHGLPTLALSIDDFYLTRADQLALAAAHPDNPLIQHRGEPGTHDLTLLDNFLTSLLAGKHPTPIPRYDKSAHAGQGDRFPPSAWASTDPASPPRVVILEGWCVGFRALPDRELEARWNRSRTLPSDDRSNNHISRHELAHVRFINDQLSRYEMVLNARLDAFIHLDAQDIHWAYAWRAEQEEELRRRLAATTATTAAEGNNGQKGGGAMTEEQVVRFVDGYMPAYELYADGVREGVFLPERRGRQLRIVAGRDRRVVESMVI
jgi:D-glycerate 3-kinase